ncbi:MAG: hypothetical protein M0Z89_01755 [Nitrospiraceae bacterium]|nr:hypothetical protein [Nitrospiraceae bacterium]
MKKSTQVALSAVLVFSLAIFISACSSGGGSSSGGSSSITSLSTTTQGAQTAAAGVTSARNVASSGVQLSSLVNSGSSPAPAFRAFAGTNMKTTAVGKFVARFSPIMKKAQVMRTSAMGYPMAISCSSSASGTAPNYSNDSITIDMDASGNIMTLTFTQCADTTTYNLTDGVMTITGAASSGIYAIGTNTRPFIVADYTSSSMTTTTDMSQVSATMSSSTSATGDNTMSVTGLFEDWDYVLHSHDKQTMTNLSINSASTTAMISNATYSVSTLTIDGSEAGTTYVSDIDPTINYTENASFSGFSVADKTPASGTGNDYLSINGIFSISTTPANKCIDGTFSIVTNTDIAIDPITGQTQSGQMTINSNVVVIFQANGAVSVSVNGGTAQPFTLQELDSVCAL